MNDSFAANTKAAADDLATAFLLDELSSLSNAELATLSSNQLVEMFRFMLKELTTARNECNLAREQLAELKQQIRNIAS